MFNSQLNSNLSVGLTDWVIGVGGKSIEFKVPPGRNKITIIFWMWHSNTTQITETALRGCFVAGNYKLTYIDGTFTTATDGVGKASACAAYEIEAPSGTTIATVSSGMFMFAVYII